MDQEGMQGRMAARQGIIAARKGRNRRARTEGKKEYLRPDGGGLDALPRQTARTVAYPVPR